VNDHPTPRDDDSTMGFAPEADTQVSPGNAADLAETAGSTIGPYKLLQQIGEGGFGVVFMAEQTEPVRRQVALKIIKLGMDTREVIARFEAERQALAMMDHPNIARVLDAGATETGRPYFVMELVRGIPITRYCDEQALTLRQRLELFTTVCNAVQHAHQKGVIHRDLKPSNVMVTLHDGTPVPKVIDFGVSKATNQRLTEKTLFTQYGAFVGTPQYMSPEQAEMSGLDVDTRADIYSLGVMLYELLTGETPINPEQLRTAGMAEMHSLIQNTQIQRPSNKLSTTNRPQEISRQRSADPRKLGSLIKGDLDWIVLKAAAKERARRYDTASALADDIQRYLTDKPVHATPPSLAYNLTKFAKRNRIAVTAGAAIAAALVLGLAGSTAGLLWALDEREKAAVAEEAARREAERSKAIADFTTTLLTAADASSLSLEDAVQRAEELFGDDHAAAASLLVNWGAVLTRAAEYDRARSVLTEALTRQTRALGEEHPNRATTLLAVANALAGQQDHSAAAGAAIEAVEIRRAALGEDHPLVANALQEYLTHLAFVDAQDPALVSTAEEIYEIRRAALGDEHPESLRAGAQLGTAYYRIGDPLDAIPVLESVLSTARATGRIDEEFIGHLNTLVIIYVTTGNDDRAAPAFQELIDLVIERNYGGPASVFLAACNHALWLEDHGTAAESVAAATRALDIVATTQSVSSPTTLYLGRVARLLARLTPDPGSSSADTTGPTAADEARRAFTMWIDHADRDPGSGEETRVSARTAFAEFLMRRGDQSAARNVAEQGVSLAAELPADDEVRLAAEEALANLDG
jgi:serine/threonine protein kinase